MNKKILRQSELQNIGYDMSPLGLGGEGDGRKKEGRRAGREGGGQSRTVASNSITWAYHYNLPDDDCK